MKSIKFYLCLLAFVSTLNSYSQISFKGLVVDNSNEKPIREAAILLMPVDDSRRGNSLLKTATSDKGMFDISVPNVSMVPAFFRQCYLDFPNGVAVLWSAS